MRKPKASPVVEPEPVALDAAPRAPGRRRATAGPQALRCTSAMRRVPFSRVTVRRFIREGRFPAPIDPRGWRYWWRESAIDRWVREARP